MGTEEEGGCLQGAGMGFPQEHSDTGHVGESMLAATADEMDSGAVGERRNLMLVCECMCVYVSVFVCTNSDR